jgi:hypothetical protein
MESWWNVLLGLALAALTLVAVEMAGRWAERRMHGGDDE